MQAYGIDYEVNGRKYTTLIDAKSLASAKTKLGRKHGYKTGRKIKVLRSTIVGYY